MPLIARDELRPGYVEIDPAFNADSILSATGQSVSQDQWEMMVNIIEYSINEGGDMFRDLEEGDCYPEFSFECATLDDRHFRSIANV